MDIYFDAAEGLTVRSDLERNLASKIEPSVVSDILNAYVGMLQKQRAGDSEGVLTRAGKFVEHVLRGIEFIRTGVAPAEIKSPSQTVIDIGKDQNLPEGVRILAPRIAMAMIYDVRSKRGAVHVKGIDPRAIDADLAVKSASWIMAELIRLYHVDAENAVQSEMMALTRTTLPLIETINGEIFVNRKVPPQLELMLLLAQHAPAGLSRRDLSRMAKCDTRRISDALKVLDDDRFVHLMANQNYILTGPGEAELLKRLSENTPQV